MTRSPSAQALQSLLTGLVIGGMSLGALYILSQAIFILRESLERVSAALI